MLGLSAGLTEPPVDGSVTHLGDGVPRFRASRIEESIGGREVRLQTEMREPKQSSGSGESSGCAGLNDRDLSHKRSRDPSSRR